MEKYSEEAKARALKIRTTLTAELGDEIFVGQGDASGVEMERLIAQAITEAVEAEKQRCAKIAEEYHLHSKNTNCRKDSCFCTDGNVRGRRISEAIRAGE